MAASDADWAGEPEPSDEDEHRGRDRQVVVAALDDDDHAGRCAIALASHDPSFALGAPITPFDAGGPAPIGL